MMHRTRHADKIIEATQSPSAAAKSSLAASWYRSALKHGLDPDAANAVHRVEQSELDERRSALQRFMMLASPRLDTLFSLVGQSGCAVLLTDAHGIILDQRISDGDMPAFEGWGLTSGADWSEARQGTNGIGTCLTESRRIIIDRGDHFFARNTGMSCIDAPIYGVDGSVIAALDVSSARADQTEAFNRLISAQVGQTARAIEETNFRAAYPSSRIVVADVDDCETAALLAIDQDDLIVGATRAARGIFGLQKIGEITVRPAADILGREDGPSGFQKAERAAVVRAITRANGNISQAARQLGVSRATLYRRIKRLGLDET